MNEKLSLPPVTTIEQLQQQQQQQQPTHAYTTIDHADYHYESTLTATTTPLTTTTTNTTTYNHEQSNSNNEQTLGRYGSCEEGGGGDGLVAGGGGADIGGAEAAAGGGLMDSNELYRYASVASLGGGGGGGVGGTTMLPMDVYMPSAISGPTPPLAHAPLTQATTILKISGNGSGRSSSKGSNMNSPHKQQLGAPQRDNFCGCFGCCDGAGAGAGAGAQALTFWPALFANLGICTLLLGYLFIGSFLFLTIETSGDGGSAAGVVIDPNAWSYAKNAYISTQQQQQQTSQPHKLAPQPSLASAQPSKLYTSNEPLLDATNTGGAVHQIQEAHATHEAKLKPHESSSDFHMNTPKTKWQADEGRLTNNSTGDAAQAGAAAAGALTVAKQFELMSKPETETYIDNRHASKLWSSNMEAHAQQAVEAQAYHGMGGGAIGNDINSADVDVDTGIGVGIGMAGGVGAEQDGLADDGALAGGAWGGENVALQRTVENIWDITVSLNILYKENWTKLAALEINKFQDQLVKRLVMDLTLSTTTNGVVGAAPTMTNNANLRQQQQHDLAQQPTSKAYDYHSMKSATSKHYGGNDAADAQQQQQLERYWQLQAARQRQWQLQKQQQQFEWNFATSFLYSLTVVTTVGYGTITPRTTLGRMVTIVYATFGIPLTLVYLSSIGSILAKLASSFCERLLCCCFCRPATNKRHTICGFSRQQVSDKKCNLKLQQLHNQQQHTTPNALQSAQQQQHTTKPAHLPYCYVRPPADDALSYGEHSPPPLSSHSSGKCVNSIPTLRWSLALPLGFCVLLLLAYVAFGSLVIALLEQWTLFDGIYFCFMSLTTIGFCDLLPGAHIRSPTTTATSATSTFVVWFCAVYILSGLTLTSMCVNLLHDEFLQRMRVVVKFKKIATDKSSVKERSFYGAPP